MAKKFLIPEKAFFRGFRSNPPAITWRMGGVEIDPALLTPDDVVRLWKSLNSYYSHCRYAGETTIYHLSRVSCMDWGGLRFRLTKCLCLRVTGDKVEHDFHRPYWGVCRKHKVIYDEA